MSAVISDCGAFRYTLHRRIPSMLRWVRPCLFIMLNPSTADATQDDPTIRRCLGFAKREGCTSLTVVNLYALRATDPAALTQQGPVEMVAIIGPDNDRHIREQAEQHRLGIIVAAWGAHPMARRRERAVADIIGPMYCLGTTKAGAPRHPLYVKGDAPLLPWEPPA